MLCSTLAPLRADTPFLARKIDPSPFPLAVTTSTYGEAKEGKVLPCYILGKAAEPANSMGVVLPKRLQK